MTCLCHITGHDCRQGRDCPLRKESVARLAQDFEAMNAPQIRRDRWREWRPVVLLIVGLALAALALHVWPVAAAHIAEPLAGKPY